MIHHIVLFTLREDLAEADRKSILAQAEALAEVPSVRSLRVGSLLDPEDPGYRSHIWADFSHALLVEFENEPALYAYQSDPLHMVFAKAIRERVSTIRVIDMVSAAAPADGQV